MESYDFSQLIYWGANVNVQNKAGLSALHWACHQPHKGVLRTESKHQASTL